MQLAQSQPEAVEQLFQEVQRSLGTPTMLVNNAGMDSAGIPVQDMPYDRWDQALKTNLYGPFLCCQQFIRGLDGSDQRGVIISPAFIRKFPGPEQRITMSPRGACGIEPALWLSNLRTRASMSTILLPAWC